MSAVIRSRFVAVSLQAIRVGVGSGIALYIALLTNLEFAVSAAIVAMLTIVTTKIEALKLSLFRFLTFALTVLLCFLIFPNVSNPIVAYILFLSILVCITDYYNLRATLSVNAVVGTHFLTTLDFSMVAIFNEFTIVTIGICIAILSNFVSNNTGSEKRLQHNREYAQMQMKALLQRMSQRMQEGRVPKQIWNELATLREQLGHFQELSEEYIGNTFVKEKNGYTEWFHKRMLQCEMLETLQEPIEELCAFAQESEIVAEVLAYIAAHLDAQEGMQACHIARSTPQNTIELEVYTKLYHSLKVLEEFEIEIHITVES